jgi:hypothetical protein
VRFTVTATVLAGTGTVTNTVTVTPPNGTDDPNLGNNTASDTDSTSPGIAGGHFDFDIYYYASGKYGDRKHIHQYDDKYDVTGVNMLAPSEMDFKVTNGITNPATTFKILVMNQYLNPAAKLAIGPGTGEVSVKTYGNLASETNAATLLAGLPTYTTANISRFIFNAPKTAFHSQDWWGTGGDGLDRAGIIPTQTGCVNHVSSTGVPDTLGPQGERYDGALTIQIIKDTTPDSALELNVPGDVRYGWRVKAASFTSYVLTEYTVFWHHPNGKCYGAVGWVRNPPEDFSSSGNPTTPDPGADDPNGPVP